MAISWKIDPAHTAVSFSVRHMMFAKVRGKFGAFTADLSFDPADVTRSSVKASIDAATVDTGVGDRDAHLRSADFFDVEHHPNLVFASRSIEAVGGGYRMVGDLTIRGVTKPVTLDVEALGSGKDPWGNERRLFSAKTSIVRSDFGLVWNQALEAGGVLVSDKVDIEIDAQIVGTAS